MLLKSVAGSSALVSLVAAAPAGVAAPTANVLNGTYAGATNAHFGQDLFLGLPYAQQPVGNLRFALPQSLNETWDEEREAKAYSDICVGYGVSPLIP